MRRFREHVDSGQVNKNLRKHVKAAATERVSSRGRGRGGGQGGASYLRYAGCQKVWTAVRRRVKSSGYSGSKLKRLYLAIC